MILNWLQTAIAYNYWAHRRIWDCIMQLSEEDFVKPVAYSMGSVKQQIVHTMWAEAIWYARLHDQPRPEFTAEDFASRADIRAKWDEIEAGWREYIASVTEDELSRPIITIRANGERYEHSALEIIMQIINHGTDHRAQMLQLIHGYGGETFAQDLIYYLREGQ